MNKLIKVTPLFGLIKNLVTLSCKYCVNYNTIDRDLAVDYSNVYIKCEANNPLGGILKVG